MNKVCVITGAGGVLCSSFAEEMAKQGYKVALLDLNDVAAGVVADRINANGGVAKAYKVNCLEKESVERCVCDYVSGMTDRYAIQLYNDLFIPQVWRGR